MLDIEIVKRIQKLQEADPKISLTELANELNVSRTKLRRVQKEYNLHIHVRSKSENARRGKNAWGQLNLKRRTG